MNHDDQVALLRRRLVYEMSLKAALDASNAIAPLLHLCECAGLVVKHDGLFRSTLADARGLIQDIEADYRRQWADPLHSMQAVGESVQQLGRRLQSYERSVAAWLRHGIDARFTANLRLGDWVAWNSTLDMVLCIAEGMDRDLSEIFAPPCLRIRIPSGRVRYLLSPFDVAVEPLFEFGQWNEEILMDHLLDSIDIRPTNVLLNAICVRAPEVLYLAQWAREIELQQGNRTLTLSLGK